MYIVKRVHSALYRIVDEETDDTVEVRCHPELAQEAADRLNETENFDL